MSRRATSSSPDTNDITRALRRAAKNALELGLRTGTPVYIVRNGKIVDLTKELRTTKRATSKRAKVSSRKSAPTKV